jgi:hypothetical protein
MKPCVVKCEDGSTLIEFISKEWRFGICIEKERKESSWYLVTKKGKLDECDYLSKEFLSIIKENI